MRRRRGQPAGQVLAIGVAALVLAALVNADALVRRAEAKPFGPGRDRSLAIWHPVQDLSHVLQLYRVRQLSDWATGNQAPPRAAPVTTTSTTAPSGPASTTTTLPPRPELRVPTAAAPLRVWIGGDSVIRDASQSFLQLTSTDPLLSTVAHYEISTGLTRPDYFDWPAALATDMAATDPEVVFVMFGANDSQGIVAADGTVFEDPSTPGWKAEYAARVGAVMDQLRADGRLVFWIGQPPMRDAGFDERMQALDAIYEGQAATRPWVQYVDTAPLFGDGHGGFGDPALRKSDGIHLSQAGADLLAQHLLDLVAEELPAPTTTTTASTGATGGTTSTTDG